MRFWIIENTKGEVVIAETTCVKAVEAAEQRFEKGTAYWMYWIETAVTAEIFRSLLTSGQGEYVKKCNHGQWYAGITEGSDSDRRGAFRRGRSN